MLSNRSFVVFVMATLLVLPGCMRKVTVTYVPTQRHAESVGNKNTPKATSSSQRKIAGSTAKQSLSSSHHLTNYLKDWQGVRYRFGGNSSKGVDCSGLTKRVYKDIYGVDLPRTVAAQSKKGKRIKKKMLQPGDLIFFKTGLNSRHVGIYVGDDRFIHASRSKGVTQSDLKSSYWRRKYWQAKRYLPVNS